ncbi:MAG: site-specific DNA-methyltransferase [Desulfococcaceae bacterium]
MTPQEEKLKALQAILPEAFAEGKVDWEKLKAALGEDVNFSSERYVLNWAGKSEAFRVLQTPCTGTLIPVKNESVNFDETGHIFIEGENLEVLKVLQKSYFGKVKMIYIDPPYNTGNDSFVYPDRFAESTEDYQKRVGDRDDDGYMTREGLFRKNSRENGQYHSNWLNMMYPRLFLAKNLLRQDGVIFVSIDDNEVHNLRLLMNEVFGEENFVVQMIWHSRQNVDSRSLNGASTDHEYVLCYSKNVNTRIRGKEIDKNKYANPDNDPRGSWMSSPMDGIATKDQRPNLHYIIINPETGIAYEPASETGWRFQKSTVDNLITEKRIIWPKNPNSKPRFKRYLNELNNEFTGFSSILNADFTAKGTKELRELFGMETLKFPKPVSLIKTLILQGMDKNDFILDFFAGSGTTAHAVMDLNREDGGNRKFICVQIPEPCDEKSEAYKAGYKTIADIAKERIRRVTGKIEQDYAGLYRDYTGLYKNYKGLEKRDRIEKAENGKQELGLFDKDENPANPENQENPVQDLGFKVFKLADSNFKQWRSDTGKNVDVLQQQMMEFTDPLASHATVENMVYELLLKSGKDLNSKVEHKENYHCINSSEMILMLEKADEKTVEAVIRENPQKVIALDRLFEGNDQLKTNTAMQMRDAGIEFKTI